MVAAGRGSLPQGHLEGHQVSTALAATPAVPTPTPLTPLPAGLAPMSSPVSSDGEHCLRLAILSAAPGLSAASSPCPDAHLLHPSACAQINPPAPSRAVPHVLLIPLQLSSEEGQAGDQQLG